MTRNARRPDRREEAVSFLSWTLQAAGDAIARNPIAVGGCTAFLVTLSYVSANALWYQPHFHDGAFFSTRHIMHLRQTPPLPAHARRPKAEPARVQPAVLQRKVPAAFQRPVASQQSGTASSAAGQQPNTSVLAVQAALTELKYYNGPIDGVLGSQTRKAVADFQKASGLDPSGNIDASLLGKLKLTGTAPVTSASAPQSATPQPEPRPVIDASLTQSVPANATDDVTRRNIRIQAGLKAFGNEDMKLDGIIGPRTKAAIREFQSLFGLPVTGEPDDKLLAKMRQEGLTN